MGLDQYANVRHPDETPDQNQEIAYWRKHPNLHGFMESVFRKKGGTGEFNLDEVQLDHDDLDALETAVKESALPETKGFFFGSPSNAHYKEHDLEFVKDARAALAAGLEVYYSAWW